MWHISLTLIGNAGLLFVLICGDWADVHTVQTSYAFKLLLDEMKSLGVAMRLELEDRKMSARDAAKIPKRIQSIKFGLLEPNEIRKMSAVEVKTADTYRDDGHAFKQGLMDPKMGVIDPGVRCETCGNQTRRMPKSLWSHMH